MHARGVGADVRRVCWPVNDGVHVCVENKRKTETRLIPARCLWRFDKSRERAPGLAGPMIY